MNILVTGGAGYIGSHTCRVLAEAGYTPIVFDNLEHGFREAVADYELFEGDLRKPGDIDAALKKYQPTAVVHFAAFIEVGESVAEPLKYFENNVMGSLNLFKAMVATDVKKLVFSSTCATYGEPESLPLTESEKEKPESPYGESKLLVEKMLKWLYPANGLSSVRLRYFNVSGAWPDGSLGEGHVPETHIIPRAIKAAMNGEGFKLFGDDYDTPDGTCVRDYIHVVDLAKAHVAALQKLEEWNGTDVFNAGVGEGYSNRQILEMVQKVSGKTIELTVEPRRPGDPAQLYADNGKIKRELGWEPTYGLEDIVTSAYNWHSTHPNGYAKEAA